MLNKKLNKKNDLPSIDRFFQVISREEKFRNLRESSSKQMQLIVSCYSHTSLMPYLNTRMRLISHIPDLSISLNLPSILRARWRRNQANPRRGSPDADSNRASTDAAVACGFTRRYIHDRKHRYDFKQMLFSSFQQSAGRSVTPAMFVVKWLCGLARHAYSYLMRTIIIIIDASSYI